MRKRQGGSSGGAGRGRVQGSGTSGRAPERGPDPRQDLVAALRAVGLDGQAAEVFSDSAMVLGALSQGRRVRDVRIGSAAGSARAADAAGTRPRADATPGSMEHHLREGDVALGAVEALAACTARLEAAMVVATGEQVTAVGGALLAQRDVSDPGELSRTARERWRARAKSRVRQELAPAIGWTPGECAHLVAVACAPLAFGAPIVAQMASGDLPWRLARSLWRACEGMDAADAAHVATVMCGDDPATCVPERLAPDGSVQDGPWHHRAFYAALAREVAKITHADGADEEAGRQDRARREAAFAGRRVSASVDDDGTGSLTVITSAFWVAAIKDRLHRAARAARGAGDQRTLDQLESDIARIVLAHGSVGVADQPWPSGGADGEGGVTTTEDLVRAGWSPELVQVLSGLPPAVLQVVVPLMGLHDPAVAETLPTTGRAAVRPGPNSPAGPVPPPAGGSAPEPGSAEVVPVPARAPVPAPGPAPGAPEGHTGRPGCPACLPSVRASRGRADGRVGTTSQEECARTVSREESAPTTPQEESARRPGPAVDGTRVRRLWVGEVLGRFPMFVPPAGVRALTLAPGTTLSRLLVDPADGRCVERSITAYRPDAAMRAQILAADVTCRAPACDHAGGSCQVDHVIEYGTPDGVTKETNGQLAHTGHHETKTVKDWDADLSANRDVEWTTVLGRIYRTRAWDYRRYVTLLVDAVDAVRSAPAEDRATELDRQVYLALTHRELEERLNVGDDDLDPDIIRFEGWPFVGLTHRDRHTGRRAPGPSEDATAEAHSARALAGPVGSGTAPERTTVPGDAVTVPHACTEPCCRALRRAAGLGAPPTGDTRDSGNTGTITRIDGRTGRRVSLREYRELRKAWTLANHEGIVPF